MFQFRPVVGLVVTTLGSVWCAIAAAQPPPAALATHAPLCVVPPAPGSRRLSASPQAFDHERSSKSCTHGGVTVCTASDPMLPLKE